MKDAIHLSIPPRSSSREKDRGVVPCFRKSYCVVRVREIVFYTMAGRANLHIMSIKGIHRMISPCENFKINLGGRGILTRLDWVSKKGVSEITSVVMGTHITTGAFLPS